MRGEATSLHDEGIRRRRVAGGKEQELQNDPSGTPRKTTTNNTSNIGSGFSTVAKPAETVKKDKNESKSKPRGICAGSGTVGGAVVLLFGFFVAYYVIFQPNNNNANPLSLLTTSFGSIFPLKKATDAPLGDGPVPRPKDWHLWGYYNFKDNFNCSGYLKDRTKPLPTMEYWETMLKAYNQVVDPTYKFDPDIPPTQGYRLNEDGPPPYYAKLSPGKGRGLFASRDIQKGEIVHNGTKSDVVFPNETSWKRFMFAMPRKMACDNAEWSFTQQFEEDGPMRIVSSLNIAILMNEGNTLKDVNVEPKDDKGEASEYSTLFRAIKDIKKDEEILMDYANYDTDYAAAGLAELRMASRVGSKSCVDADNTHLLDCDVGSAVIKCKQIFTTNFPYFAWLMFLFFLPDPEITYTFERQKRRPYSKRNA
eukprot:scaffold5612_cov108-Skeletonema_dohrnii-CCMP3373.AAC.7